MQPLSKCGAYDSVRSLTQVHGRDYRYNAAHFASMPAMPYLVLAVFALLYLAATVLVQLPLLVAAVYGVMSITCFAVYAIDKRAARAKAWRTPEKTLWLLGLLCGWPGALLAQQWLRHKTAKRSFQVMFWIPVVVNMMGFAWMTLQYAQTNG